MKKMKRILSLMLVVVMSFSVIGVIPVKAATEKTTDIAWFGNQNGNPWNGSNWTFLTGKDGNFEKMTNYIARDSATASLKPGWSADADSATAFIDTWRHQATQEKWAVTAFDIAEDGNITGTSGHTLKTSGAGSGEVMVVLKNTDGFYPVWPSKGEWTWQTVADTAGISVNFTTGYKAGDTLYYIVKPSEGVELTRITICPKVTFVGGTATDYPTAFTEFGGDVEVKTEVWEEHSGWYVTQATQPWSGSYFTFEYLDLSTNEFKKLETHVADKNPAYWQDTTGNVVVKGWEHFSTSDKYSAVAFTAGKAGHVKLNTSNGLVGGGVSGGQYAVIQRSGDSYFVIKNWTDVATGETKTFAEKETYVEEGEIVYFLTRSTTSSQSANLQLNPKVTYTIGAKDTNNLHPSTWGTLNSVVRQGKTLDISWYAAQNGNPNPGSPFTFEYFDRATMEFKKLETYVKKENAVPFWQDSTGKVQVKTWEQVGIFEKYVAVAFTADKDMHVILESKNGLLEADDEGGQFMLVQRSGESYHALLDWTNVPANQSITLAPVETYMKAGETVYFMYRAEKVIYTSSQVIVDYIPQVTYTTGVTDTDNLYPDNWGDVSAVIIGDQSAMDAALEAPAIKYNPTDAKYLNGNRFYQGCPDVVIAENGRMWATWAAGGFGEDEYNYVPLYTSMDGGETWSEPKLVMDVDGPVRFFENQLWVDPDGRLWVFWAQSYYWFDGRCGVWAMYTENPEDENPTWSEPVRIADGVARNNPVVLKNGDWILPTALWTWSQNSLLSDVKYANAYISKDKGATWEYLGSVKEYEGERNHDENMIIEQNDGSLRMLIRTMIGIEESYSYDGGKTWTAAKDAGLSATVSRFYIGRLASGNQLLVYNNPEVAGRRSHLTAAISEDDGKTWPYKLVIDERWGTSYPDVQQTKDGTIYISYDCGRTSKAEILMAQITEADIKAGTLVTETSKLKFLINDNTTTFAGVETKSGEIKGVEAETTIFSDNEAVFLKNINDWFLGKSYLYGSMEDGFSANVTADGWMYILTPITGNKYSQQEALEADGFELIIELPAGKLAATINEPLAVMAKQVKKGEAISMDKWAIMFADAVSEEDKSLNPPKILINPKNAEYQDGNRLWQGIPGIAKDNETGRLWSAWYSGGFGEGEYNWVTLSTSNDDGETWEHAKVVVNPEYPVRAFDPNLWVDPDGRMWLFWSQSYYWNDGRCGVWAMYTENPGDENPTWSEPVRIAHGIAMNDPIVLSNQDDPTLNGAWLLPTAIWVSSQRTDLGDEINSNAYISFDKGKTWSYRGSVKEYGAEREFDENMIVERSDGTLMMYIRTKAGIQKSLSTDGGQTWTASVDANLTATVSRFNITCLASGNLLLIYHDPEVSARRSHLTAALSEDDGETWTYKFMVDERWGTTYPDVQQDADGNIYITYDNGRSSKAEILMAKITEADIKAGTLVTETSKLRVLINDNKSSMAAVSANTGTMGKIAIGATIFSDRDYAFSSEMPGWLSGRGYLLTSRDDGFNAKVTRPGWVYILTPSAGEASQVSELKEQGYELLIELPAEDLSSGITEPVSIMCKQVEVGETISGNAGSVLVQASIWTNNISWYAQQNTQPWAGSYYTFEYFDVNSEEFKKLETYVDDATLSYWQDETGTVVIKSWQQLASDKKYSSVTFTATEKGVVTLTNNTTVTGRAADGQIMIVQKSGNKYHVLMDWTMIPESQSVTLPNIETYVKAGDSIYYVYRSMSETISVIEMVPGVNYVMHVDDTDNQYPTEWVEEFPYRDAAEFTGMTLSLDGTIGFNFYVSKNSTLSDEAYATFALPSGETQKISKKNAVETNDGLKFTCQVPAKEMADTIVATLCDGGKVIDTKSVSVRDYAEAILENEENLAHYAAAQPLVKAMINYGAYAQKLFNYNVENLANKGYETDTDIQNVGLTQLSGFAKEKQGKEGFGSLAGASLILEGETTLRMFFAFESSTSLDGLRFTVNGEDQMYKMSGDYYIVEFANIAAGDLDKDYTVTVTAGDNTFNAVCSAMTFCRNALVNSDNIALQNVAKALYLYNTEANAYFNQ